MTIESIDLNQIPQSSFVRKSRILDTKEFREAVAALPTIKPGKALRITLSPETQASAKNAAYALKRHLVAQVKESKLKLEVAIRKGTDGVAALYISNPASK
jgi:hypothetical protein